MRVVSLVYAAPTGPPLHSYQISKYVQGYRSYGVHKDASTNGRRADRYIPEPIGRGIKINYEKVEIIPFGVKPSSQLSILATKV